jgi:hypothetical protein
MSQFLCVVTKTVVDQNFVRAVPEVPGVPGIAEVVEDLTAVPPIAGVAAVAAIPAIPEVPEVPLVTHEEVSKCYVEDAAAQVAKHLADPSVNPQLKYYSLKFTAALKPQIKTVKEKGRANAPVKEIITIEDQDGNELGSSEI